MARQSGRHFNGPRLSPEQAARQGRISQLAIARLGAQDAIAFLNGNDEKLGGRPLDLAIESFEGLRTVEQRLEERTDA
ncbi:hypothetical protein [Sphingobium sp. EM0848]|uniref:hypothetical protein n=1 Tax=Sphingobium sp. EM0848 TaxID=2743473 RepID=UPI001C3FDAB0|nr:hypothetical protein [Sphingobium sp. EM0848]